MQYSEIMIRYGELSTKGKNRMRFINKLRNNISDVFVYLSPSQSDSRSRPCPCLPQWSRLHSSSRIAQTSIRDSKLFSCLQGRKVCGSS